MSNNFTKTERLIQYIDGGMNDAEKALLQKELKADETMQAELENLLLATDIVKKYGLSASVAGIHKEMMEEMNTLSVKQPAIARHMPRQLMKIAAGIIVLLGLFGLYQYFSVSANGLYTEHYNQYTAPTFRGAETSSYIEKAYAEKKYDSAIAHFKLSTEASVKDNFFAGQSYLVKENYAQAIICFKNALNKNNINNTNLLSDDAEYYLALSCLKNNDLPQALPLFQKIHNNKAHTYNNKVSNWFLKKLQLLNWKQ